MEMIDVYSSVVDSIGYDETTQSLHVKWSRGDKTSVYRGVPRERAEQVMRAPSIGSALRESIQGAYEHSYL